MQAFYKLILQWVVLPLTKDLALWLFKVSKKGVLSIVNYFKEKKRKKKLKKENEKKVEDYKNANNQNDNTDSFSNLP